MADTIVSFQKHQNQVKTRSNLKQWKPLMDERGRNSSQQRKVFHIQKLILIQRSQFLQVQQAVEEPISTLKERKCELLVSTFYLSTDPTLEPHS